MASPHVCPNRTLCIVSVLCECRRLHPPLAVLFARTRGVLGGTDTHTLTISFITTTLIRRGDIGKPRSVAAQVPAMNQFHRLGFRQQLLRLIVAQS